MAFVGFRVLERESVRSIPIDGSISVTVESIVCVLLPDIELLFQIFFLFA
jgi:hypothetical protein